MGCLIYINGTPHLQMGPLIYKWRHLCQFWHKRHPIHHVMQKLTCMINLLLVAVPSLIHLCLTPGADLLTLNCTRYLHSITFPVACAIIPKSHSPPIITYTNYKCWMIWVCMVEGTNHFLLSFFLHLFRRSEVLIRFNWDFGGGGGDGPWTLLD